MPRPFPGGMLRAKAMNLQHPLASLDDEINAYGRGLATFGPNEYGFASLVAPYGGPVRVVACFAKQLAPGGFGRIWSPHCLQDWSVQLRTSASPRGPRRG